MNTISSLGLSFDFKMFSFVVKFGNRPFVVFNVVCWRVIIQLYQIVFKVLSLSCWRCGGCVVR